MPSPNVVLRPQVLRWITAASSQGAPWKPGPSGAASNCASSGRADRSRTASSKSFNGRLRDECLNVEWFTSLSEARAQLASWRHHYNHQRPHSALDDRAPAVFASLHGVRPTRFALPSRNKTNTTPRQALAAPAVAALDPARRLPEDTNDQGEALFRIARSQSSLLSLWSDFQARNTGSGDT